MSFKIKFFNKAVLSLTIFVLFFSVLEMIARTMYQTRTHLFFQAECFERIKNEVEVIFFGASQMVDAVNPQYINKKSFNLGFPAQDLYYDYMRLKNNIDEMPLLKTIVIELSFQYLFYDEAIAKHMHCVTDYYWTLGILPKPRHFIKFLCKSSTFAFHQDEFIRDFIDGKKPIPHPIIDIDYVPDPLPKEEEVMLANGFQYVKKTVLSEEEKVQEQRGRDAVMYHESIIDKSLLEENLDYLNKIIDIGKKRDIKIIFITLPSIKYYRQYFNKEYINLFNSTIDSLLKDHPQLEYYDFGELEILEIKDFLNASHLNYTGARKFSIMLNSILNESKDNTMVRVQKVYKNE